METLERNQVWKKIFEISRKKYPAKTGFSTELTFRGGLDYRLSKKDNILSSFHLTTYGLLGYRFIKVGGFDNVITLKTVSAGIGLKYVLWKRIKDIILKEPKQYYSL